MVDRRFQIVQDNSEHAGALGNFEVCLYLLGVCCRTHWHPSSHQTPLYTCLDIQNQFSYHVWPLPTINAIRVMALR